LQVSLELTSLTVRYQLLMCNSECSVYHFALCWLYCC